MRLKEYLYLYRVVNWRDKISGVRPVAYIFLGYLMAGRGNFNLFYIFLNTAAVLGVLIFVYLVNDYYDWKLHGEKNYLSEKTEKVYGWYFILPMIPAALLNFFIPARALVLFWTGFALILLYSLPPLRLKERKVWGFLVPPAGVTLLFLQGYILLESPGINMLLFCAIIFLFQCYLEALHVLEDSFSRTEVRKIKETPRAMALFKMLPLVSLAVSAGFIFFNRIFIVTAVFSLVRVAALKGFTMDHVRKVRRNFLLPHLSLYEFGVYGSLGFAGLF